MGDPRKGEEVMIRILLLATVLNGSDGNAGMGPAERQQCKQFPRERELEQPVRQNGDAGAEIRGGSILRFVVHLLL